MPTPREWYVYRFARHVWWTVIGLIGGILGVVGPISDSLHKHFRVALWVWVPLLVVGLSVAQYRAWRDMRVERDVVIGQRNLVQGERDQALTRLEQIRVARSLVFGDVKYTNLLGPEYAIHNAAVQVGMQLRNFGQSIVAYQVEDMRVELEGRTLSHPNFLNTGSEVVPPGGLTDYNYPSIPGFDVTHPLNGIIDITIVYGHPDLGMARRLHEKRSFTFSALVGSEINNYAQWTVLISEDKGL